MNSQAILIDSVDIPQSYFCKKVGNISQDYKGTVLIVPKKVFTELNKLPLGKTRIEYIKKANPLNCFPVSYTNKICQIQSNSANLECVDLAVGHIKSAINPNIIWMCVPLNSAKFDSDIDTLASLHFGNPYITDKTPCNQPIKHSLAMTVDKVILEKNQVLKSVSYALEQYKKTGCQIECKFDDNAIAFLKKASDIGHTVNKDGKKSQKEITGKLYATQQNSIFVIHADTKIETGSEENIHIEPSRFNYHSHPREAYIRHSVKNAWPSLTDCLGFLQLGNSTIFHCVAGIEGLYIMSFGNYWVDKLDKVDAGFVKKHYDFDRKVYTPEEYVNQVNSLLYKGHPIYNVKFLPWKMCNTLFSVSYNKHGLNCFTSDKHIKLVDDIHSSSEEEYK